MVINPLGFNSAPNRLVFDPNGYQQISMKGTPPILGGEPTNEADPPMSGGPSTVNPLTSSQAPTDPINPFFGGGASMPPGLSQRQQQMLTGLAAGKSTKELANDIGISPSTVKVHLNNLFNNMGVTGRTQALAKALAPPVDPNISASDQSTFVAPPGLSSRQAEALQYLLQGGDNKTIARQMGVSPRTVQAHLADVYDRMGVDGRMDAISTYRANPPQLPSHDTIGGVIQRLQQGTPQPGDDALLHSYGSHFFRDSPLWTKPSSVQDSSDDK